jgi:hypothetical protein
MDGTKGKGDGGRGIAKEDFGQPQPPSVLNLPKKGDACCLLSVLCVLQHYSLIPLP